MIQTRLLLLKSQLFLLSKFQKSGGCLPELWLLFENFLNELIFFLHLSLLSFQKSIQEIFERLLAFGVEFGGILRSELLFNLKVVNLSGLLSRVTFNSILLIRRKNNFCLTSVRVFDQLIGVQIELLYFIWTLLIYHFINRNHSLFDSFG